MSAILTTSSSNLIRHAGQVLLNEAPKRVILSGPSGFLGSRVVRSILSVHKYRRENGVNPGELVILSSKPGRFMDKLTKEYGPSMMSTVRASRVDYYTQHDIETWIDNLGSLKLEGDNCVFVNLAAVAGPDGTQNGLSYVNYNAPLAAAKACEFLGFGHWIQSSTQATHAERASQVRYSRGKAMCDFALSRLASLPVTIASLGLLYNCTDGMIGQDGRKGINLIDLALLPLTPILGNGTAPLQPQEITDASDRIVFLALTDPALRPVQPKRNTRGIKVDFSTNGSQQMMTSPHHESTSESADSWSNEELLYSAGIANRPTIRDTFRKYDAVGPEVITMLELLETFAKFQGRRTFRPVHIGYDNMESILNIMSFGNLNRQFLSLLRSEQESHAPAIGDSKVWENLLGPEAKLLTLNEAFDWRKDKTDKSNNIRRFPFWTVCKLVLAKPMVILPGIKLTAEILNSYISSFSRTDGRGIGGGHTSNKVSS